MTIKGASILLIKGRKNITAIKTNVAIIIKIVKIGVKRGQKNSI